MRQQVFAKQYTCLWGLVPVCLNALKRSICLRSAALNCTGFIENRGPPGPPEVWALQMQFLWLRVGTSVTIDAITKQNESAKRKTASLVCSHKLKSTERDDMHSGARHCVCLHCLAYKQRLFETEITAEVLQSWFKRAAPILRCPRPNKASAPWSRCRTKAFPEAKEDIRSGNNKRITLQPALFNASPTKWNVSQTNKPVECIMLKAQFSISPQSILRVLCATAEWIFLSSPWLKPKGDDLYSSLIASIFVRHVFVQHN